MQWSSAPNIGEAPLPQHARSYWKTRFSALLGRLEALLEAERAQLPPWFVVGLGSGIGAWFVLGRPAQWAAFLFVTAGMSLTGFTLGSGRAGRALGWFACAAAIGCALVWARADWVAAPRLERPGMASFDARIEMVESLVARGTVRLTLRPEDPALPPKIRVSIDSEEAPAGLASGAVVRLRARLAPPPPMALPGTYDFARDAWFKRIGAVGKAMGPVTIVRPASGGGLDEVRRRLGQHIRGRLPPTRPGSRWRW